MLLSYLRVTVIFQYKVTKSNFIKVRLSFNI